jgi:hypothetical protein
VLVERRLPSLDPARFVWLDAEQGSTRKMLLATVGGQLFIDRRSTICIWAVACERKARLNAGSAMLEATFFLVRSLGIVATLRPASLGGAS